ncbi:MAG: class I SAM-dependent methyltransferase [Burkholderiaceae bacterium]|nr:class I SAM-dependent methyltransferase [Burkholderiaceae bacterium]
MVREASGEQRRLSRKLRLPILLALWAQCLSLFITLTAAVVFPAAAGVDLPAWVLVLLQGVGAAVMSRLFKLAPWWLPMQLAFPLALLLAWSLQLPSTVYLAAFLFCLLLYWTTFRTQVPFYPSGPLVWSMVEELLPRDRPLRVIDIGSGFGGMALRLAERRPDSTVIGIEVAPLPWLCSRLRAACRHSGAQFWRGDYHELDFGDFDVVFAYLSPAAMPALWEKVRAEMRSGSLLLSYEFPIPEVQSQIANRCGKRGTILYGWHI